MPSAQDCAERLKEQAYRTLLPQVRDLEQELQSVTSSLSAGFEKIGQKLEALQKIELPTTELILREILEEVIRQKDSETNSLLLFMRGLLQRETQEEILSLLLDGTHEYFPRVALFVVRGDRYIGWSSRGFSDEIAHTISSCSFPRSEYPPFQEVFESENSVTATSFPEGTPLQFLSGDAAGPYNLYPLRVMQLPTALLLTGGAEAESFKPEIPGTLSGYAALRLENIALKILYELRAVAPKQAPEPVVEEKAAVAAPPVTPEPAVIVEEPAVPQVPEAEQPPEPEPVAVVAPPPEPIAEPELLVEPEPLIEPEPEPVVEPEPELFAAPKETAPIPTVAPVVEEVPPPMPPPEAAKIPLPETIPVPPPEAAAVIAPPEPVKVPPQETKPLPEEEKLHTEAKRFARLLVSEIKLYNEKHVIEGRGNRDLYLRLKRDIDRSREMYEKRISPIVSRKIDYFHDEIIRILGDNDPSSLGSDYPGPRVDS
jgi:hypothetical protein